MAIRQVVTILNDTDKMPFGKYKGWLMQDVPPNYLHWVWENLKFGNLDLQSVRDYIFRSLDALKQENDDLIWSDP